MKRIVLALLFTGIVFAQKQPAVFPNENWQKIEKAESVGYSTIRLEGLRAWLKSIDTTGMMVSVGGKSMFEYGDLSRLSYLASVRKSLLAILYGNYVEKGVIDLSRTLKDIGLTDHGGLMSKEETATIEHLITARSGVFHPASNAGDRQAWAPPRNSVQPGTYQLYNNWDFNAAGAAFEKLTGKDIYDALESDLARPIGMQDFDRSKQQKSGNLTRSMFPAYHIFLSTRDMARVGLLMLRKGDWNGKRVVSSAWVHRISSMVTQPRDVQPRFHNGSSSFGYGVMWWVRDDGGLLAGTVEGHGAGGQYIAVIPALDMVIAHKTDVTQDSEHRKGEKRSVTGAEWEAIVRMVLASRCGAACR